MPRFFTVLALALSLQITPVFNASIMGGAEARALQTTPLRVVVLPFKNITRQPQDDWISDSFAETLTMGLVKVSHLHLIERVQVQTLIKEQQFSQTAFADENTAPQLGKMLGANVVVLGSYQKVGERLQANVRFVDVETGHVDAQHVEQVEGLFSDIFQLQKSLANKLVKNLDVKATPTEVAAVAEAMTTTTSTESHRLYIEGLKYMDYQGKVNLLKAIKSFEKAKIEDPKYAQVYAGLAEAHARLASLEKHYVLAPGITGAANEEHDTIAEKYALRALELKEDMPEVYRAVATLQKNRGDLNEALVMIKTAVQLNPRDHLNFGLYMQIREEQERFLLPIDSILKELKLLGVDPSDPWLKYNLAAFMLLQMSDPLAVKQRGNTLVLLKEAERGLPDYPGIPLLLASTELSSGNRQQALIHLDRVFDLSANHPYYRMAAIQFLGGLGQPERALKLIKETNQRFPDNRQIESTYAMILMQNKKDAEGNAIFERLKKDIPSDPFLPFNRGLAALAYAQDFELAQKYFKQARSLYSPQGMGISKNFIDNLLVVTHLNLKEYAEAIVLLEPLRNDVTFNRSAYTNLSTAYSKNGNHEQALTNYEAYFRAFPEHAKDEKSLRKYKEYQLRYALSKQPQDIALLNDLGQILQTQYHYNEAKKYYKQALSINKDHPVIHANLGSLFLDQQDYKSALSELSQAIVLKPDYTRAWFNKGLSELGLGHKQLAQKSFERVLSLDPNYAEARAELKKLR